MKNANIIHIIGLSIVIIGALLMIFHIVPLTRANAIFILGSLVWSRGQSMKIRLLKKEIQELKNGTAS